MHATAPLYRRHRFPSEIISHTVWLYFRFALSYRDVEVRHEASRWNEWKTLPPVQAGGKSLGRSTRRMQSEGEIAGPERYW